jgi:hypothetical protein
MPYQTVKLPVGVETQFLLQINVEETPVYLGET